MRILISDYSGHAFPVQLSRALARRGHEILHISSASFQTPKGRLEADAVDPPTFRSISVNTRKPFAKHTFIRRRRQEIEIGHRIGEHILAFAPDIVLSGNAPLDVQRQAQRAARQAGAKFVLWIQDLYGEAIHRILRKRLGFLGSLVGGHYLRLEAALIRRSDHNIVIAPAFAELVSKLAGIGADHLSIIENWAPLDEIPEFPRDNAWVTQNLPPSPFRMVYSGTLGFKHNPDLLFELALQVEGHVVVFSEGPAAESLRERAKAAAMTNLQVFGWLPFEQMPEALAGADLMVAILEPDAGVFSVPSKVLTYLSIGRPILGAIPSDNLAAQIIEEANAGVTVAPTDAANFIAAAKRLSQDPEQREKMARAARTYAERTFEIDRITTKFEDIFNRV